jgi:hypothetical protein
MIGVDRSDVALVEWLRAQAFLAATELRGNTAARFQLCADLIERLSAQAIEAFGQDAKRLDGEATKARSEGCATQGGNHGQGNQG